MYERYSILADETLKAKSIEEVTFEDYIAKCQEKEKAIVDIRIEASSQQTRLKLLHETLAKRTQEHNSLQSRSKDLVSGGITERLCSCRSRRRRWRRRVRAIASVKVRCSMGFV
eukprot:TRINITY_DN2603_c0_g1_i9.p4 TRINITY_DN2603_c0_g1~~TRINITY_DN2603_c0_g1_i9.p4  ORF type:complete len:114 (+),score=17.72 TRINITY_DN2603_c0_g1_i9:785-1126(+)